MKSSGVSLGLATSKAEQSGAAPSEVERDEAKSTPEPAKTSRAGRSHVEQE